VNKKEQGQEGEGHARSFLEKAGYRFLAANTQTRYGEVDLVMEKGTTVVFVEVRVRGSNSYGSPAETVTKAKQKKVAKAAIAYAKEQGLTKRPLRFDVVAIEGNKINHIPNAFVPTGYYL